MTTSAGLPGFNTPAVGFEQPFAMLEACHERVERTLTLLSRLRSYLREQAVGLGLPPPGMQQIGEAGDVHG